jgi:zinc protease
MRIHSLPLSVCLLAGLAVEATPQAGTVRLPDFAKHTLANGAVIQLAPRRDVPLVNVQVLVRGGGESDPMQQAGLAAVTAELLTRGTRNTSAEDFTEAIDFIGARLNTGVTPQATAISMEFLPKDTERALALLGEALFTPAFSAEEVTKNVARRIDQAKSAKDQPQRVVSAYFDAFHFGAAHPYGKPLQGDEVSLARISRDDIVGYHQRLYAGSNIIVTAAGDFDAATMRKHLEKVFAGAQKGSRYQWAEAAAPAPPQRPQLLLVDKPDATQTYFVIGQPGIHRTHPDRVPVWLVNTLFGGRFTSMLNDALRVNSGLTYGAGSQVDENRMPGAITIQTFTKTETTVQAVDMALDLMKQLNQKGITAEQLASAKAYVKGTYPPRNLETATQIAAQLGQLELYGLSRGEIDDLFSRIDAVTVEKANEVARRYYGSRPPQLVLIGNAAAIRSAVGKYAPELKEVPVTRPGIAVTP